jgi:hypothetical protein
MKSKITLTKLFTLAILLVSFTVVSASTGGDDSCKTKCCKSKKTKTVSVAVADIDKAFEEMEAEIRYITVAVTKDVKQSLRTIRYKKVIAPEPPVVVIAFDIADDKEVDAKQKINFNALDKEMNQVQEDLSKMDDGLKCDDVKNRKAAEEILKTVIKS